MYSRLSSCEIDRGAFYKNHDDCSQYMIILYYNIYKITSASPPQHRRIETVTISTAVACNTTSPPAASPFPLSFSLSLLLHIYIHYIHRYIIARKCVRCAVCVGG